MRNIIIIINSKVIKFKLLIKPKQIIKFIPILNNINNYNSNNNNNNNKLLKLKKKKFFF